VIRIARADGSTFPPEDLPITSVLRTGQGTHSDGEVFFRRDGTTFPAEYWSFPVRPGGRVEGAVVTFLDVTDRKRAEGELFTASKRREQFLAMLSHELRNPLAAVIAATRVLRAGTSRRRGSARPAA